MHRGWLGPNPDETGSDNSRGGDPERTKTGFTPEAYLTILFFDERFNFIPDADGGVAQQQVMEAVGSNGSSLTLPNIKAPKNGYAYVYVSNQSKSDVYFDNFQVGITQGNIAEENHYYAYGLKIATLSSKKLGDVYEGTLKNNYLYNGKELFDDADLNWYDYGFRNYDPQIGRFPQLDPLTDSYPFLTPYQYASCDPITNIDIDGLEGGDAVTKSVTKALDQTATAAGKVIENVVLKSLPRKIPTIGEALSKGNSTMVLLNIIKNSNTILNTATNTIPVGNSKSLNNTKPVNCHGAYQNGYTPASGDNSSNYDGIVMTNKYGGGSGRARIGKNPDPESIDISIIIAGALNTAPTISSLNLGYPSAKLVNYLKSLKDQVKNVKGGLEIYDKYKEQTEDNMSERSIPSGEQPTPVIKYDTVPGEWNYYEIKNGKFKGSSFSSTRPVELFKPGEKDAPDTIIKTTVTQPPIPKKSIKRKPL
jgi:RHS repeat-associated protein